MKYYTQAYDELGRSVLGNLSGQTIIRAKNYKRTTQYKMLRKGSWPRPENINAFTVHRWYDDVEVERFEAEMTYQEYVKTQREQS